MSGEEVITVRIPKSLKKDVDKLGIDVNSVVLEALIKEVKKRRKRKVQTTVYLPVELVVKAKRYGINLSKLLEELIKRELRRRGEPIPDD